MSVATRGWHVVDYFVLEQPGRWGFGTREPGRYALAAFENRNRDLIYQPGEAYGAFGFDRPGMEPLVCAAGTRRSDLALAIPEKVKEPFPIELDIQKLQARGPDDQVKATLGAVDRDRRNRGALRRALQRRKRAERAMAAVRLHGDRQRRNLFSRALRSASRSRALRARHQRYAGELRLPRRAPRPLALPALGCITTRRVRTSTCSPSTSTRPWRNCSCATASIASQLWRTAWAD